MSDERLRVPIDSPYLQAVGLAVICFARLEWNVVWCCEKLQSGYLRTVGTKTAGQIANDFIALALTHPDSSIVAKLGQEASNFKFLVGRRNDLMHANPGTDENGEQRLFRRGKLWTISEIEAVSDEFTANAIEVNRLFHDSL